MIDLRGPPCLGFERYAPHACRPDPAQLDLLREIDLRDLIIAIMRAEHRRWCYRMDTWRIARAVHRIETRTLNPDGLIGPRFARVEAALFEMVATGEVLRTVAHQSPLWSLASCVGTVDSLSTEGEKG